MPAPRPRPEPPGTVDDGGNGDHPSGMEARLAHIEDTMATKDQLKALGEQMHAGFGYMEKQFGAVAQRFAVVDKRFDTVDQRFAAVDKRFDEVDRRFAAVDKRFDEVDQRFAAVDKRFDEVDQRFATMDGRFDEIDRRFTAMDKRFDKIEDTLETIIEAVYNKPSRAEVYTYIAILIAGILAAVAAGAMLAG